MRHPRDILLGASAAAALPVCDHYCGVEARIRKSLALQAEMIEEFGACVFDVTLDCEDGAPVGGEEEHAVMVASIANEVHRRGGLGAAAPRVAARVHPVDHPAFDRDLEIIVGGAAQALSHLMIPKVEAVDDVEQAVLKIDQLASQAGRSDGLALHVLIESARAVRNAYAIAAHPRVESLSFGLMDFVSAHAGAIPSRAMAVAGGAAQDGLDQFSHPLVVRAKLEISAACHANAKVPSHCVVTEFGDPDLVHAAARQACEAMGYTRMWSIHPAQIRPILDAFSPRADEIALAADIMMAAMGVDWAPISMGGRLHDRASYRYFWHVLERAHRTGRQMPALVRNLFE